MTQYVLVDYWRDWYNTSTKSTDPHLTNDPTPISIIHQPWHNYSEALQLCTVILHSLAYNRFHPPIHVVY